ncbi:hypothetical protein HJC23_008723 [Cyclotella cryptica]|uniref:Uncharacterized protein n=1 Tax=Cyclotella cryptica TaxID=29204 RepID=A0ABD3PC07_9STRA|eukprot:CCRYP_015813-RA/>CCRYP_015813-RA protein AED:0.03 eAED:0.03 QI:50/1/1/1/1/1/5/131/1099
MPITIPLLDALLAGQQDAESHYGSIPPSARIRELTSLLTQLSPAANAGSHNDEGRAMLAATLLRRDLSCLSFEEGGNAASEIAEPLMILFENNHNRSQRMLGRCVAELCGADGMMGHVLKRLETGCAAMSIPHLQLLSDLVDRYPLSLWSSNLNMISLFGGITNVQLTADQLEATLEALVGVGVAYEKAKRVMSTKGKSDVEKALLMQIPERCTEVDIRSPPAEMGMVYLPTLLNSLLGYLESSNVDVLSKCIGHLSTCSMQCPSLLAGGETSLTFVVQTCMSIAQSSRSIEDYDHVKLSALDVIATICSVPQIKRTILQPNGISPKCVTGMGRRPLLEFLIRGHDNEAGEQRGVFALCAELIVSGVDNDEEEWSAEPASIYDSEELWESDRTALYAESLMETFVEVFGGAPSLPPIFQLVDVLLARSGWQNERAVLSILERCISAAPVTFAPHVPATVDTALRLAQSASFRVQYQALQVLGSLCIANSVGEESTTGSQIIVREKYGDRILECVAHLTKSPCSRVASNACLAIVSYCRGGNGCVNCMIPIEKGLILPFVGPLLEVLQAGPLAVNVSNPSSISEGSLTVLIRAIDAVACLADASGEEFLPYYGVMGGLISCATFGLEKEGGIRVAAHVKNSFEMKKLRGSALEAATIVGAAVSGAEAENVELYVKDASEIMTIATTLLNSENFDIVPMDQLLAACARIAAVMGSRYAPFLPSVLPHILKRATEKLDVSITEDEQSDRSLDEESEGYSICIPGVGTKKVKINTTQLEEKSLAARALYEHARALGKDFDSQCIESSVTAFLPLVGCVYSGEVRSTSALALSQVFRAACLGAAADHSPSKKKMICEQLFNVLSKALVSQLLKENDDEEFENRNAIADALSEVMYDLFTQKGASGEQIVQLSTLEAKELVSGIVSLIQTCLSRRTLILSEIDVDVVDDDEMARCNEKLQAEAELLTHLVDSVGYQLKALGEQFVPIFVDHVAGPLGELLTLKGTSDPRARVASVCLFDDCIEYCGSKAANVYAPMLLEGIAEGLDSNDEDLQSASAYGLLQIVSHAPRTLHPQSTQVMLSKAFPLLEPEEQEELQSAIQNAIQI